MINGLQYFLKIDIKTGIKNLFTPIPEIDVTVTTEGDQNTKNVPEILLSKKLLTQNLSDYSPEAISKLPILTSGKSGWNWILLSMTWFQDARNRMALSSTSFYCAELVQLGDSRRWHKAPKEALGLDLEAPTRFLYGGDPCS